MELSEKDIIKIIKSDVELPIHYQNTIIRTLSKCKHKEKNKMLNMAKLTGTVCASIIMTTSIAYGGYIIYQKVWKEPKQYTEYEDVINNVIPNGKIIENENIITEEEAKNIATDFMNKIGYSDMHINNIELKRNYEINDASYYLVKTKTENESGIQIHINSRDGAILYFNDLELKYKKLSSDSITEEQAKKIAINTYYNLGLENLHYELSNISEDLKNNNQRMNNLWKAEFNKKYNDTYNPYENVLISFIVVNNKVMYDTIIISNIKFEENEIIISKEQAMEIAKLKEQEFTKNDITDINASISIEKSNTLIYQLENNIYNTDVLKGGIYLDIDEQIRKVWKVNIKHNNKAERKINENSNQYIKENCDKEYYIDATTGEIIGGQLLK